MSVKERYFKVIDYEKREKGPLTEKQYLVYAYLLSISKWNPTELHYYVYKNSFLVKEACTLIGVSQPTWRNALKKLDEENYIHIDSKNKVYKIYFDVSWAKLDLTLIRFLVESSYTFDSKIGGICPSLYGVICRYWNISKKANQECCVVLSQLSDLFFGERTKAHLFGIWTLLQVFQKLKLMYITEIPKKNKAGQDYKAYRIDFVETKLSKEAQVLEATIEEDREEAIGDIIKSIVDTRDSYESFYNIDKET